MGCDCVRAVWGDTRPYVTLCHFGGPSWMTFVQSLILLLFSLVSAASLASISAFLHATIQVP